MNRNMSRESTCKGLLALALVIAIVGLPLIAMTSGGRNQEDVTTPQNLRLGATGSHEICFLSSPLENGTLSITVSDSSSSEPIVNASVRSTETPSGQPQISNLTLDDGSVTFMYLLTGSYTFEVAKDGYSTTILGTFLDANESRTIAIALSKKTHLNIPTPSIIGMILMTVCLLSLTITLVRRASRGDRYAYEESAPTYSYESASGNGVRSESSQEPKEPLPSSRFCPYCGVTYVRADASYCWNCGAALAEEPETSTNQGRTRRSQTIVGRCMVCNLDIRADESIVSCRYCRNIAHRNHMLQWLQTRSYCPDCYHHLDERDLRGR